MNSWSPGRAALMALTMAAASSLSHLGAAEFAAERWRVAEIPLTSATAYADPFNDVDVTATFTGPAGEVVTRPAFWDGGTTWKVRFAPTVTGTWTMTTTCSDAANAGLQGVSHTVQCSAYSGALPLYQHGFIKVAPSGRYFTYADGTPFFYLGDTHWLFIHERFSTSNIPGVPSQFKYTVDKRVTQGFTVFQSESIHVPHGTGAHSDPSEEPHADFRDGFTEADLPGLANMDRKFAYIADSGLVHAHAGITWAGEPAESPIYTEAYMARLGKYWAARFGAYPVLWTVAQEIDPNLYGAYSSSTIGKWYAGAQAMSDNDGYGQPLGAHLQNLASMGSTPANSVWGSKPYHKWWPVQMQGDLAGHAGPRNFYQSTPAKPVVMYESPYENFWTDAKGARGSGYKAFQWGMCGYGYGGAGVWNDIYAPGDYGTAYEMPARYLQWYDGANLAAAAQMSYLKSFYTALEWWKLTPRYDDAAWSGFADPDRSILSSDGSQTYVVYFFGAGKSTGTLRNMAAGATYEASWFDPRTGATMRIGGLTAAGGQWIAPARPTEDDWVLLVKQSTATIVPTPATGSNVTPSQSALSWQTVGLPSGLRYEVRFGDATRYNPDLPHGNLPLLTPAGGTTATSVGMPSGLASGVTYYWILSATDPAASTTTDYTFSFTAAGASIPVTNGSFETSGAATSASWAQLAGVWSPSVVNGYQQNNLAPATSAHFTAISAGGGSWYALMNGNTGRITQDLNAQVHTGDTLSVTFYGGRAKAGASTSAGGVFNASLVVGTTKYTMPVDTTTQANNSWEAYTLTKTVMNDGPLSLEFSAVTGDPWLDQIGPVAITTAPAFAVAVSEPAQGQRVLSGAAPTATATVANGSGGPYTVRYELAPTGSDVRTVAGSSTVAPYAVSLGSLADGSYDLWATVTDAAGIDPVRTSLVRSFTVAPDVLIPVPNGSFETTGAATTSAWARIEAGWNPSATSAAAAYQQNTMADSGSRHLSQASPGGGTWFALINGNTGTIQRSLGATVNAGDVIAVSFFGGRATSSASTAAGGVFKAALLVGTDVYEMNVDTTAQANDTWQLYTLQRTVTTGGPLSIRFLAVSGDPWLDGISSVSVTPAGPGGAAYQQWMSGQTGVPQDQRGFLSDPDRDGLANGMVWALGGGNALASSSFRPAAARQVDGSLDLFFDCLPVSARGAAVVLQVEYSSDAVTWQSVTVPEQSGMVNGVNFTVTGGNPLHVVARVPKPASGDKLFARVRVTAS